jgi:hypothetical protein
VKNCIILGFGRSGTSLMGGILYHSGYFMGDNLYHPRESNPKGFFENEVINGINEKILSNYDFIKIVNAADLLLCKSSPFNPLYGQRWLSYIEAGTYISCFDDHTILEIKKALDVPVFAYKDPRFNFTLPLWNKYLSGEVAYICMFRQPEIVVESVLKDCTTRYPPGDFYINREIIIKLWYNSYKRVLQYMNNEISKKIIFVHYEQLLSKEIFPLLTRELDVYLDDHFVSHELNRSRSTGNVPQYIRDLYESLCGLSGFHK